MFRTQFSEKNDFRVQAMCLFIDMCRVTHKGCDFIATTLNFSNQANAEVVKSFFFSWMLIAKLIYKMVKVDKVTELLQFN